MTTEKAVTTTPDDSLKYFGKVSELGDEKYGGGFDCWKRAAQILKVEDLNMPDEEFLEGVDWNDPKQVLLELRRAYAGGWAIGENISSNMIYEWLQSRDSPRTRETLTRMAENVEPDNDEDRFRYNWQRFQIAKDLGRLILDLPPVSEIPN